jgi:hypothetical protein
MDWGVAINISINIFFRIENKKPDIAKGEAGLAGVFS